MAAAELELSASFSDNARTRPILDGAVRVAGMTLYCTVLHPSEMFWRQLHFEEFDVSEMSISSLLISATRGDFTWAAVPIFTMRKFFHTSILVNAAAGIAGPEDLAGKRVGVPEYQQTWAVWSRGVLKDEFGVRPEDIHWFMERGADRSHGAATGFRPPPGVVVDPVPPDTDLGRLLAEGRLDATLLQLNQPNLVDRGRGAASAAAHVRPLFPDALAEGRRYYAKTGLYPVNHVVVVRRTLLDRHPWIALNLLEAFTAAKDQARRQAEETLEPYVETSEGAGSPGRGASASGDPMAYGYKANRAVLEALSRYQAEQGLVTQAVDPATVFARSTLET
jgi:4,5-dihydroxyphthalate decarboxylase